MLKSRNESAEFLFLASPTTTLCMRSTMSGVAAQKTKTVDPGSSASMQFYPTKRMTMDWTAVWEAFKAGVKESVRTLVARLQINLLMDTAYILRE